jgi:hypothetical protein
VWSSEKGPSALREEAAWEEAGHTGKTSEQALHAGEGAGKREHPIATLRRQGRPEVQCLEQERVDERIGLDKRFF